MRVFISIDIDDKEILYKIGKLGQEIKKLGALLKLVELQNIHMTLKFLGEVDEKDLQLIYSAINEATKGFKKFNIKIKGLGAFPSLSNPRVVWVGVSEGKEELTSLANRVSSKLKDLGFMGDTKPFTPHITIGRVKKYGHLLREFIRRNQNLEIGTFLVKEIRVKKSKLTPSGPIYSTLYSKSLE